MHQIKFFSYLTITCVLIALLLSCGSNEKKSKEVLKLKRGAKLPAEYTGHVQFYDSATNVLTRETDYLNGIAHGDEVIYHDNGKPKVKGHYNDGRKNGVVIFYDPAGATISQQFYFYGIICGPLIDYRNNEPIQYSFYSLDNNELCFIDYDSVKGRSMESLQKIYFNRYQTTDFGFPEQPQHEYLLYLLNPPKFRFAYSLCAVDKNFKVLKEVLKFDSNEPWVKFRRPKNDQTSYAIRLSIDDNINKQSREMFKRL